MTVAAGSAQPLKNNTQAGQRAAPFGESKDTGDNVGRDKVGPKKWIQNQTNSKLRVLHLCFLVPSQDINCNWAGRTALGLGSARKRWDHTEMGQALALALTHGACISPLCSSHMCEGKDCLILHRLRIKHKGTVIQNKVSRCYSQRIIIAELNLAQQFPWSLTYEFCPGER